MKTRNSQSYRQIINGRDIFKVFIPVVTTTNNYSNPAYVVTMVYDYKKVTNQLHQRILHLTIHHYPFCISSKCVYPYNG